MANQPDEGVTQMRQKPSCIYYMTMMCASINFIQQYSMNLLSKDDVRIFLLLFNV